MLRLARPIPGHREPIYTPREISSPKYRRCPMRAVAMPMSASTPLQKDGRGWKRGRKEFRLILSSGRAWASELRRRTAEETGDGASNKWLASGSRRCSSRSIRRNAAAADQGRRMGLVYGAENKSKAKLRRWSPHA